MSCLTINRPKKIEGATDLLAGVSTDIDTRENDLYSLLSAGNIPDHMMSFVPVRVTFTSNKGTIHSVELWVLPDYVTIGNNKDHVRLPLWPLTAQKLADEWGCCLPTPKMVSLVWQRATQISPDPWGPPYGVEMLSTKRFIQHNERIQAAMKHVLPGTLVAGHKKDIVISNALKAHPNNVAIYGWHKLDGTPIQRLYFGHSHKYSDYSHGVRLFRETCTIDGQQALISDVLTDCDMWPTLSNEGPMQVVRQPGV